MENQQQQNTRVIKKLLLVVVGMFGFGFAMVPLYDVLCDITGLNGKTRNVAAEFIDTKVDLSREIKIQFVANTNRGMPWEFKPKESTLIVYPGEMYKTSFYAHNLSSQTITGQAIPSVAPGRAAIYMNKTECFCFNQQVLKANEEVEMPLVFFIDKDIPDDVKTLTLSYSLYNTSDSAPIQISKAP